ncbi:pseudouridine synthase [Nonomuraea sp. NPDC002799]
MSGGSARDSLRAGSGGARARYSGGRDGDREGRYSRGPASDERPARDERSPRGDREGGFQRGDREGGYSRGGQGGYQGGGREGGNSRGGYQGGSREGGYQGSRSREGGYQGGSREGGYQGSRSREGGYQGGSREGGYQGSRSREGGYQGGSREGGYQGSREGGDRGGLRAGRSGRREDAAPKGATSSTRSRYGKRDGDARPARAPRRDDVQTVGGTGRRVTPGSPQNDRVKAARQPLRDHAFYPEGYTDERDTTEVPGGIRLQKVLAQAGVASRRACEEMIGEGRVTVNNQVVRRFGAKVDPAAQVIHVDGKRIPTAPDLVYYAMNKPIGVVSTMDDPQGRPCLADYVEELAPRLFHVGRLDTETEGLLLLTNDGELANRLTHPSYGVQKKYWAKVPGPIPRDLGRRLKQGIELEDGLAKADSFAIVQEHGQQALVEVVLHEGRKHVVRRMLEEAGHRVIDLARIEFGPVKLGRTKAGTIRTLSLKEVGELYAAVKL